MQIMKMKSQVSLKLKKVMSSGMDDISDAAV